MRTYLPIFISTLIVLLCFCACTGEKFAAKRLAYFKLRHPSLFEENSRTDTTVTIDTLVYVTDSLLLDTIVNTNFDTLVVDNGRVITEIRIKRGIINQYHIKTGVRSDTFKVIVRDTTIRTEINREVVTNIKTVPKTPFWVWIVVGFSLVIVFLVIRSSLGASLQRSHQEAEKQTDS